MNCRALALALPALAACGTGCGDGAEGATGQLLVTVSAEGLGARGYPFPPRPGDTTAFVDGWQVRFSRILAVVDRITIAEDPDRNPGDQGQVGAVVAELRGPWAVDLVKSGDADDKGGAGRVAHRLPVELANTLELDRRYAFGYDLAVASAQVQRINFGAADPDYQEMIDKGLRLLLIGTATFLGTDCTASRQDFDFGKLPSRVTFRFGFANSVTYRNCQNPENTGAALGQDEFQRGVQVLSNAPTVAQITLHTDHLFWTTVVHGGVPMFDQFAARAKPDGQQVTVTLDDCAQAPIAPVTDQDGSPLPWRSCVSTTLYQLPSNPPDMTFYTQGQPLRDLRDFVAFNAATMGHLNADGICYVQRNPGLP